MKTRILSVALVAIISCGVQAQQTNHDKAQETVEAYREGDYQRVFELLGELSASVQNAESSEISAEQKPWWTVLAGILTEFSNKELGVETEE